MVWRQIKYKQGRKETKEKGKQGRKKTYITYKNLLQNNRKPPE